MNFITELIATLKILARPSLLFPFLFLLLMCVPPALETMLLILLIGKANWGYALLSSNDFVTGTIYSLFFIGFINKITGANFARIIIFGAFIYTLANGLNIVFFYSASFPTWTLYIIRIFIAFLWNFGGDLLLVPAVGEISKRLPEGIESTGVTLFISLSNFSSTVSGLLSGKEIDYFNIKDGYYDRAKKAYALNVAMRTTLVFLSPAFFYWNVKS